MHTLALVREAMYNAQGPAKAVKEITAILHNAEAANKIYLSEGEHIKYSTTVRSNPFNVVHAAETEAECVTLDVLLNYRHSAAKKGVPEYAEKHCKKQEKSETAPLGSLNKKFQIS